MADVTARSLQYEYKAVSTFLRKLNNTNTKTVMYFFQLLIDSYFQGS